MSNMSSLLLRGSYSSSWYHTGNLPSSWSTLQKDFCTRNKPRWVQGGHRTPFAILFHLNPCQPYSLPNRHLPFVQYCLRNQTSDVFILSSHDLGLPFQVCPHSESFALSPPTLYVLSFVGNCYSWVSCDLGMLHASENHDYGQSPNES